MASNIKTLRTIVIDLLRQSGRTPLQAVDLWDTHYSRIITNSAPGTHVLIIGKYEVEYTVPNIPSPVDRSQLIEQENKKSTALLWLIVISLTVASIISTGLVLWLVF